HRRRHQIGLLLLGRLLGHRLGGDGRCGRRTTSARRQRGGGLRGGSGALGGEALGALVLVLDHVEDLAGLGRGRATGAAALPLRAGAALLGDALLEGFVPGVAEALVIALGVGLGLLLLAAAPRPSGRLRLGGLVVDRRVDPARAQAEGDALLVLLLAAAHHHLVHAVQARGDRFDGRGG